MWTICCSARAALARLALAASLLAAAGCATPVLSVEDEEKLGKEVSKQARRELDFVGDDLVRRYIEDLGERIVAAAGPQPFEYRFYVVEEEELNAFAAPGGHVYVQTGLITAAENVSELAAVLGHEVGHVALRHVARNYYRQRGTSIVYQIFAAALAIFLGGPGAVGGQLAGQLAAVAYLNNFSRDAEREADQFAVEVLPRIGIHPIGLATFFETISQEGGGRPPAFLSSHPAPEERIENARRAIAAADLPGTLAIDDDGKLEIIQRRIELLTGQ
jgi:predicted Zn-dependent protease